MKYLNLIFAIMLVMPTALASPGAHGPDGEHLDGPATAAGTGATVPQVETFTDSFELQGRLSGGELSIMIDRYETNEPVLNGELDVQYKDLKAKATFHADLGDYAIDDPRLLAAISRPGAHSLLFTLVAGEESDLLEGTLTVAATADGHDHQHGDGRRWLLLVAAAALVVAIVIARRWRQRKKA